MIEAVDQVDIKENLSLATQSQRFINLFVDVIVVNFLLLLIMIFADLFGSGNFEMTLIFSVLTFFYYVISEYVFGKTIGKLLTKTKVLTEKGERPDFSQFITRSLSRLLFIEVFSFIAEYPVGWHDKWSKTRVVKDGNVPSGAFDKNKIQHFEK